MKDETTPLTFSEAFNKGIEQGREFTVQRTKRTKIVCGRIKNLRLKKDITQSELCSDIVINRITYSGYENGRAEPPMEVLVRIADYYDVSLDYIAGRTNDPSGMQKKSDPVALAKSQQIQEIEEMKKRLDSLLEEVQKTSE